MQNSGIDLGELRKTISKTGIFNFFNTSKNDDASSDEDHPPNIVEDDIFVRDGHRGIVVLKCHCLKSNKRKIFHLHLYSGQLYQYADGRRKIRLCADICGIFVRPDYSVVVDLKRNRGVVRKMYTFDSLENANRYQKYIEFRNDIGPSIRAAFDAIDRKGAKLITSALLCLALKERDIYASDSEIRSMLLLNDGKGKYYDFQDFFNLFLDTQVGSLSECLEEWLYQSKRVTAHALKGGPARADVAYSPHVGGSSSDGTNLVASSVTRNGSSRISDKHSSSSRDNFDEKYIDADSIENMISLIPGESIVSVDRMRWCVHMGKTSEPTQQPHPGCIVITTYRVVLLSPRKLDARMHSEEVGMQRAGGGDRYVTPKFFRMTSVPLSAIFRVQVAQPRNILCITVKDYRVIRVTLSNRICLGTKASVVCKSKIGESPSGTHGRHSNSESRVADSDINDLTPTPLSPNGSHAVNQSAGQSTNPSHGKVERSHADSGIGGTQDGDVIASRDDVAGMSSEVNGEENKYRNHVNVRGSSDAVSQEGSRSDVNTLSNTSSSLDGSIHSNAHANGANVNYVRTITTTTVTHSNGSGQVSTISSISSNNVATPPPNINMNGGPISPSRAEALAMALHRLAFYQSSKTIEKPFAYGCITRYGHDGWAHCDLMAEYSRQGILGQSEWKVFNNSTFALCESYPPYVVLPSAMTEVEIWTATIHRSRQRLPVVTYMHSWVDPRDASSAPIVKENGDLAADMSLRKIEEETEAETGKVLNSPSNRGAIKTANSNGSSSSGKGRMTSGGRLGCPVLTRSSQPLVGMTNKSCGEDEKLLNLYRLLGHTSDIRESENGPAKHIILDARRQSAATLNMVVGKGTEDISLYSNTDLVFCNLENIHVVRASAQAMADLLFPGGHLDVLSRDDTGGSGYFQKLEDSGWLKHVALILKAGVLAAEKMHLEGVSVLVHCSDGWDRTAQICSVTQLLLDPYFRTLQGLAVLIEKEWCAFGFKFQDRSGHGMEHTQSSEERSPVFLQFLDCVFQILTQFPTSFEFNESILLFLADHVHSGLFGTFLGNSYKQRFLELKVRDQTHSIWSYIFDNKSRFCNERFCPILRPIWPSVSIAKMVVWDRYFNRWSADAHPSHLLGKDAEWHNDWGSGLETE